MPLVRIFYGLSGRWRRLGKGNSACSLNLEYFVTSTVLDPLFRFSAI